MNTIKHIAFGFVLLLASCNSDADMPEITVPMETETTSLHIDLQNDVTTKAGTPAPFHLEYPEGTIIKDIRFVLQVLIKNGEDKYVPMGQPIIQTAGSKAGEDYCKGENANTFTISYPKGIDYRIAVWADYVKPDTKGGIVNLEICEDYSISALPNIERRVGTSGSYAEVLSSHDAYAGVKDFTAGSVPDNITATRPLALLSIQAIDADLWDMYSIGVGNKLEIKVAFQGVPQYYNMYTGNTEGSTTLYALKTEYANSNGYFGKISGTTYFSGLVFAPKETSTYSIQINSSMGYDVERTIIPNPVTLTNVPLQRNFRTNVAGNLFINHGKFTVSKSTDFNSGDIEESIVQPSI